MIPAVLGNTIQPKHDNNGGSTPWTRPVEMELLNVILGGFPGSLEIAVLLTGIQKKKN